MANALNPRLLGSEHGLKNLQTYRYDLTQNQNWYKLGYLEKKNWNVYLNSTTK